MFFVLPFKLKSENSYDEQKLASQFEYKGQYQRELLVLMSEIKSLSKTHRINWMLVNQIGRRNGISWLEYEEIVAEFFQGYRQRILKHLA